MDNVILKVNDLGLKNEFEKLFSKIKVLVEKLHNTSDDNKELKEKIKELEQSVSNLKIELTNKSSESLAMERELTDLKNKLLDEKKNRFSNDEKSMLKSRIKELINRLDSHIEQKPSNDL